MSRRVDGKSELWLADLERNAAMSRLVLGDPGGASPLWSRDGSRMVFATTRNGPLDIYQRSVDRRGDEALLVTSHDKVPAEWSPDGRTLLYIDADPNTHLDVWALPVGSAEKPFPVVQSAYEDLNPQSLQTDRGWRTIRRIEPARGLHAPVPRRRRSTAGLHGGWLATALAR